MPVDPRSVLLVTLDSCRFDSFATAHVPNMKSTGEIHKAMAPSHFTFGSHVSMFVGFTPGVPGVRAPYVNPKYARIFKVGRAASAGLQPPLFSLDGKNIAEGFAKTGARSIGTGAVRWFDPTTDTGAILRNGFDDFYYPGDLHSLDKQVAWVMSRIAETPDGHVFVFLNIGETHVPYFHKGADWDGLHNPCIPFSPANDARECRRRQIACLEYVDAIVHPLLDAFADATTVICGDHGDCWGEDGIWEHGVSHEKTLEVPLILRIGKHHQAAGHV